MSKPFMYVERLTCKQVAAGDDVSVGLVDGLVEVDTAIEVELVAELVDVGLVVDVVEVDVELTNKVVDVV